MRGMNVTELMPNLFKNEHYKYMRNFYEVGEKKFLDIKGRKIFALDRKNAMMLMEKNVKLFPILNHNILYIALKNRNTEIFSYNLCITNLVDTNLSLSENYDLSNIDLLTDFDGSNIDVFRFICKNST